MVSISVCMVVKDEEENLERCLESVKDIADEIVIVDTGSGDRTKDIARRYTNNVFDFKWVNDFSRARNFSLSKAVGEWVFFLDADETVSERDIPAIKQLARNRHFDGFSFVIRNYTNNQGLVNFIPLKGDDYPESRGWKGYDRSRVVRMFRRRAGVFFEGEIHEVVEHSIRRKGGKIMEVDIPIHHFGERSGEKDRKYLEMSRKRVASAGNDPKALFSLGFALFRKGDFQAAESCYRKAVSLNNNYREAWFGLSEVLGRMGRLSEAVKVNRAIAKKWPSESAAYYNLGELFLALGRKHEAVEYYEKALELGSPLRDRIVKALNKLKRH